MEINWGRLFRSLLAYLGAGLSTFFTSVLLETVLFRPLVKARPELFPWNRELNGLSLILAAIIGGRDAKKRERRRFVYEFIRPKGMDKPASRVMAEAIEAAAMGEDLQKRAIDRR